MLPRALTLLALCAALAAALPVDQYGDVQSYEEAVDERQERAAAPWGEEDDLGQQSQQYQQSDDLAQESQQYQQSDDLSQDTQESDDLTQDTQQSDDLTQDTQQSDDLTQETQQSDDLTQETQQSDDLTQETQRDQQSDDLTQESQQYQQSDDLTQETQQDQQSDDLTQETQQYQQSDDLTQETQQDQQSDDLSQETQQSDDVSQYSQQSQQESDFQEDQKTWSRKPSPRVDEGTGPTSGRLTDGRGRDSNTRDNTGGDNGNNWNTGTNGNNWNTGSNGNNWNTGSNTNGDNGNGAGNTGSPWGNGGNTNTGDSTSGFPGGVPVNRPTRPLTPPPDYKKLPPNGITTLGHYKVYTTPKTWVEAVMVCAADAAELAIAASQQEATEMGALYKQEKKHVKGSADKELFFVGASDLAKENDFVTLSGQRFQDGFFFRWQKGEPNNHKKNEHCVLSNEQGLYWDGNCNAKFAFVCRFKTDPCARPPQA